MRIRQLLLLAAVVLLFFAANLAIAKELEGFGDDSEDASGEDEFEEVEKHVHKTNDGGGGSSKSMESPSGLGGEEEEEEAASGSGSLPLEDLVKEALQKAASQRPKVSDWDEDEFEGVPYEAPQQGQETPGSKRPPPKKPAKPARVIQPRKPMEAKDHVPEIIFLCFLVLFAINYFLGSARNEKVALSWAEQYTSPGSVFEKNFSLLGTGDSNDESEPLMIKEGQSIFKFYASGRRFCECALATLDLRGRHDMLTLAWYLIFPKKDTVKIDVYMNSESMQPFILAVVPRKNAKSFLKDHRDLKEFCSIMDFSSQRKWLSDDLAVITDCREAALELLNDVILDQLFGEKAFDKNMAKHFVSLHFTDQGPGPIKKKVLTFEFAIPPIGKMADVSKLVAAVPYFIDAVAKVTLSAQAKSKAEAARSRAQQVSMKELQEQRQEEILRRREEKKKAEEAKMSPQELARKREKEAKKNMKPKSKLTRIH